MGFLSTSCSFTRFRVKDQIPKEFWETVVDKLKQHAFHDIDDLPEERAYGWVSFDDMLEYDWNSGSPYKGDVLTFSLRLDTRRIPSGVLKKHLAIAFKEEFKKLAEINKKYIAKDRKKEIKEQVTLKLMQRFLPIPAEFNVVWIAERNEVWFCSTQGKMIDLFVDYFRQTFELNLEQITPTILAERFLDEDGISRMETLEATQFTTYDGQEKSE